MEWRLVHFQNLILIPREKEDEELVPLECFEEERRKKVGMEA